MTPDDRDFRERFAQLRSEQDALAPSYRSVWSRSPRRAPRSSWALVATVAAVAVAMIAVFSLRAERQRHETVEVVAAWERLSIDRWEAPTEFLLATPASDVMDGMPDLDSSIISEPLESVPAVRPAPGARASRRSSS